MLTPDQARAEILAGRKIRLTTGPHPNDPILRVWRDGSSIMSESVAGWSAGVTEPVCGAERSYLLDYLTGRLSLELLDMPAQTTTPNECANGCGYVPIGHKPRGWQCGECDPARKTEHGKATAPTFDGLAFPVATVRYSNGHYNATIRRDENTYRARVSYDHATGGGARGARPAALKAFAKLLADNQGLAREGDYVAIPADLDRSTYAFTFVPVDQLR